LECWVITDLTIIPPFHHSISLSSFSGDGEDGLDGSFDLLFGIEETETEKYPSANSAPLR
jgi:hypothetical protein